MSSIKKYKLSDVRGNFYYFDGKSNLYRAKNKETASVFDEEEADRFIKMNDGKLFKVLYDSMEINDEIYYSTDRDVSVNTIKMPAYFKMMSNKYDIDDEEDYEDISNNLTSKKNNISTDEKDDTLDTDVDKEKKDLGIERGYSHNADTKADRSNNVKKVEDFDEFIPDRNLPKISSDISFDIMDMKNDWNGMVDGLYKLSKGIYEYKKSLESRLEYETGKINDLLHYLELNELNNMDVYGVMKLLQVSCRNRVLAYSELSRVRVVLQTFLDKDFTRKIQKAQSDMKELAKKEEEEKENATIGVDM